MSIKVFTKFLTNQKFCDGQDPDARAPEGGVRSAGRGRAHACKICPVACCKLNRSKSLYTRKVRRGLSVLPLTNGHSPLSLGYLLPRRVRYLLATPALSLRATHTSAPRLLHLCSISAPSLPHLEIRSICENDRFKETYFLIKK